MQKIISIILLVLILASCRKREEAIRWNVDLIAPVVYGEMGLSDILPDSTIVVNPDSSINLNLDLNLYSLDLDSLVNLPDTTLADTFSIPFSVPVTFTPGQSFINQPEDNLIDAGGAELTNVTIKSGTIDYQLESTIEGMVIYEYQIPVATDQFGNPFSKLVYVPAASPGQNMIVTGSFDISGYSIDLTGTTGNQVNTIQTTINVKVDPDNPGDVTTSNQDTIYVENTMQDIKLQYARGYFGQLNFDVGPETSNFDAFNQFTSGSIDIDQIDVDFELINGVGVDARIKINEISGLKGSGVSSLNHSIIGSVLNINRAQENGSTITPYVWSTQMNNSNSNIDQLLELMPDQLRYELELKLNPLGNVSGHNDFISADAPMEINMNVDMPLSAIASSLTLVDTIELNISDTNNINYGVFNIDLENGFPLGASIDIALLDHNNMVAGHVFSPDLIPSASIDGNGLVTTPSASYHQIELGAIDMRTLKKSNRIILRIVFDTADPNNHVQLYDHYKIGYKMVADFNYNVNIE